MNKELIKKYKTEFDHWLNGGKICYKHENSLGWWNDNCWNYSLEYVQAIVINDEYVEFRKAIAEEKTIQVNNMFDGSWTDIKDVKFTGSVKIYRIKPEEPEFKEGDWIKNNSSNTVFRYTNDMLNPDPSCCELWKPKLG